MAVGITFAFLKVNVVLSVSFIGVITFGLSVLGVKIGNRFGSKYENKAELVGRMYFGHHGLCIDNPLQMETANASIASAMLIKMIYNYLLLYS